MNDYGYKTWVDPFGIKGKYIYKSIEHHKSGHLWRHSAIETDSDCGNCNGARCKGCRDYWQVNLYAEPKPHIDPEWGYDYNEEVLLNSQNIYDEAVARDIFDRLE